MTSLLSTSAFHAQRDLNELAIPINRGQAFEALAALFGYFHYQEMQRDLDEIMFHLENSAPWVVLQSDLGAKRLLSLGFTQEQASIALPVLINRLNLPRVFEDDNSFLIDYFVFEYLKTALLAGDFADVAKAQTKIDDECNVFVRDDVNFGNLINQRGDFWEGSMFAQLHYRLDDGKLAWKGKYINVSARVRFSKFGRVLLDPNPMILVGANAIMPDDTMGGFIL